MSSNSITTTSATTAPHGQHTRRPDAVDTAAALLDVSRDDVVAQLRQGKSLDDVATAAGVSHDELVSALKAGLPQRVRDSGHADAIAESVATHKGVPTRRPPGPPPPPPPPAGDSADSTASGVFGFALTASQTHTLDDLATLLGTDSSSLLTDLRSGTTLADLVRSKNVSSTSLAAVIQDGLLFDASA